MEPINGQVPETPTAPVQIRFFCEVDGEQSSAQFPELGAMLIAYIQRALELGGKVVTLHQEKVGVVAEPHKKGPDCHCHPLSFEARSPRRVILLN